MLCRLQIAALFCVAHAARDESSATSLCRRKAEVWVHEKTGSELVKICGGVIDRKSSIYFFEAMAMPALCTMGPDARTVLILGGPDFGVATELLRSKYVEELVLVSAQVAVFEAAQRFPEISQGSTDSRTRWVKEKPVEWMRSAPERQFDLIVVQEDIWWGTGYSQPEGTRSAGPISEVRRLLAPNGILVYQGGSMWNMPRTKSLYADLTGSFDPVYIAHLSTLRRKPWHEFIFFAGRREVLEPNHTWCAEQKFDMDFYNKGIHEAMFVPATTVSRALGLQMPTKPDKFAVQQRVPEGSSATSPPEPEGVPLHSRRWPPPSRRSFEKTLYTGGSKFQDAEVFQYRGYNALFLDYDLQLTGIWGGFYHEGLVHPLAAALGPLARRALVVGAGDGGVASTLLKYPGMRVTQLEIDQKVIDLSKEYLPTSTSFSHPRMDLHVTDAIAWVANHSNISGGVPEDDKFDIAVIDTTDNPLQSPWSESFYRSLKKLLRPHAAIVQNIGAVDMPFTVSLRLHKRVFKHVQMLNINTPDYPSPYFLSVGTDNPDFFTADVDWDHWLRMNISTIYYQPTLHKTFFALPERNIEDVERSLAEPYEIEGDISRSLADQTKAGKKLWEL